MFARLMYGSDVKYRVRPSFFPFTEPSIEMDIWWESEKGGQWLEILGAGMVDPNVLKLWILTPKSIPDLLSGWVLTGSPCSGTVLMISGCFTIMISDFYSNLNHKKLI
jgi:hypothetical protein